MSRLAGATELGGRIALTRGDWLTGRVPAPGRSRAAIVHDFFVQDGGAEAFAVQFSRMLPGSPIYTSFFDAARFEDRIDPSRVHTWPLQRVFGPTAAFRRLLPLYPLWFAALRLDSADLVISSSSAFAKAVRTRPGSIHISYVYTPMRFAWGLDAYLNGASFSPLSRLGAMAMGPLLRRWDIRTARRPDVIVAISETIQQRIRRSWGRESEIIYPPVDVTAMPLAQGPPDGYLLVASRMLAYRRLDLVVGAATRLGRHLVVVGDGPERARLQTMAGPTVEFRGRVDRQTLVDLFEHCQAYVVPGTEDFGIAPIEAMAAGRPVVAYRAGGVTETVVDGVTGVFFDRPSVDSLAEAIERADAIPWIPMALRTHAQQYDTSAFLSAWLRLLKRLGVDPELYTPT